VLEAENRLTLIILIGLQGAGKSTFCEQRFAETHEHISMDRLRNNPRPARRQLVLLEAALQAGRSLVVDNTNPTTADRAPLIALGRQFGARIVGYYFEPDVKGSLARNQQREGKTRVPDVAIFATRKKLQTPTYDEGFDELHVVRISQEGEFEVRRMVDEGASDRPAVNDRME
jgi:predicted kinase